MKPLGDKREPNTAPIVDVLQEAIETVMGAHARGENIEDAIAELKGLQNQVRSRDKANSLVSAIKEQDARVPKGWRIEKDGDAIILHSAGSLTYVVHAEDGNTTAHEALHALVDALLAAPAALSSKPAKLLKEAHDALGGWQILAERLHHTRNEKTDELMGRLRAALKNAAPQEVEPRDLTSSRPGGSDIRTPAAAALVASEPATATPSHYEQQACELEEMADREGSQRSKNAMRAAARDLRELERALASMTADRDMWLADDVKQNSALGRCVAELEAARSARLDAQNAAPQAVASGKVQEPSRPAGAAPHEPPLVYDTKRGKWVKPGGDLNV